MRHSYWLLLIGIGAMGVMGCSKEEPAPDNDVKPREAPTFSMPAGTGTRPASSMPAGHATSGLPAGHPPIGANELPAGHPSGTAGSLTPSETGNETTLQVKMPKEFQSKPPRSMTIQVFAAPKVEGDPEDADVAISMLGTKVALQKNLDRWCGQFELPEGKTCETGVKQETLQGTTYPTTLVEIAGTYKGMSMMGAPSIPKPNFAFFAAEIVTPERPYYIKMVGPQKTVEKWKPALLEAIKAAK